MAGSTLKNHRYLLAFAGRLAAVAALVLVMLLASVQFARTIGENVALARDLYSVRSDIVLLKKRRAEQQRELRRLEDPAGAIPEIHDRLRLTAPNEAIIFVSPEPSTAP